MARLSESWKLVWRRGIARVRFRHEGRRFEITTGSRDPRLAREEAARIYAEVIGGRVVRLEGRRTALASTQPLKDVVADWVIALGATLDARTVREYKIYARAHWLPRWRVLGAITTRALGDYQRARLAKVTRTTLRKELSALRGMLRFAVERGALAELPDVPDLPRHATGKRAGGDPKRRVVLTDAEMSKLLRKLSAGHVRDYVAFAWETGLRPVTIFRLRAPTHWAPGRDRLTITADVDKSRFARELPLSAEALAVLGRRIPAAKTGRLFVRRDLVLEELHAVSEKTLKRRVGLYDLRHSRITRLVEAGGPLTGVQYLAGHKHLSTTARYAHAGLRAAEDALGALAAKGRGPGPQKKTKRAS